MTAQNAASTAQQAQKKTMPSPQDCMVTIRAIFSQWRANEDERRILNKTEQVLQQLIAEKEANGRRFISQEELELWEIVNHAEEVISVLQQADYDVSDEQDQLHLYQGILTWQANEKDAERRCGTSDFVRIMVANLATGECSLVSKNRDCRFVDAEVVKNGS